MFRKVKSLIYSTYFNMRYLPLKVAVRLPVKVTEYVKVKAKKGQIQISHPQRFGVIFGGVVPECRIFAVGYTWHQVEVCRYWERQ